MRKTLVIVDVQRDFYHPEGSLSVPGAERVVPEIKKIIGSFENVVFTADSHPVNHCSFKAQGGPWPEHCIKYTEGQGIPAELVIAAGPNAKVVEKGTWPDKEEYGAFGDLKSGYGSVATSILGVQNVEKEAGFGTFVSYHDPDEIVVCGIAAEYCVLETLKNIVKIYQGRQTKIKVFLDGVAKFDKNGTVLEDYMKENKIESYKPE